MTVRKTSVFIVAALIVVPGTIIAARKQVGSAELTCSTYSRGFVLQDPDVLAQTTTLAAPLIAINWSSMAMKDEAAQGFEGT